MWRWPANSPLLAQVEVTPLLLDILPPADSLHQAAPKTGKHLIIIVEVGTFVLGVGQEDQVERLSRTRRYMARKTQGKAQINHTAKGGRQSYGARLRQRETKAFLKEAVSALKEAVQTLDEIEHSWWHCSPRLRGLLRKEDPKILELIETRSSKLPGPVDILSEDLLEKTWHRITHGRFSAP